MYEAVSVICHMLKWRGRSNKAGTLSSVISYIDRGNPFFWWMSSCLCFRLMMRFA